MKKTFLSVLICMAVAVLSVDAIAGILYWQVNSVGNTYGDWNHAVLYASKDGTHTEIGATPTTTTDKIGTGTGDMPQGGNDGCHTDISLYQGSEYSFFVELVNYDSGTGTWTPITEVSAENAFSYNDLVSRGAISAGGMSTPANFYADMSPTVVVPEPASLSLLLIGASLLTLRRRRL